MIWGSTESVGEEPALFWLESAGWQIRNGAEIAPGEPASERDDYGQVFLARRLRDALARLNPALPAEALDDAFRKLARPEGADLFVRNCALHRLLVDGVTVDYRDADGSIRGTQARETNQSLRERFLLGKEKTAIASQVIAATIEAGLIKPDESVGGSRKSARYLPFWA